MKTSNINKNIALNMPYGTASSILRKSLLFDFSKKLSLDVCFQCNEKILTLREFSIEHKIPWLRAENPKESFFDLNNIAFSHLSCNAKAGRKSQEFQFQPGHIPKNKKILIEGMAWCGKCGERPLENFSKNRRKSKGLQDICKKCRSTYRNKNNSTQAL